MRKNIVVLLIFSVSVLFGQDARSGKENPSTYRRILHEAGTGIGWGAIGFFGGMIITNITDAKFSSNGNAAPRELVGGSIGALIGSEIGVYIASKKYNKDALFPQMTSVGILSGALITYLATTISDNENTLYISGCIAPMICSIVYSNLAYPSKVVVLPEVATQNNHTSYGINISIKL